MNPVLQITHCSSAASKKVGLSENNGKAFPKVLTTVEELVPIPWIQISMQFLPKNEGTHLEENALQTEGSAKLRSVPELQ